MVEKVNDHALKAILKYRNHPSILAEEGKLESSSLFTFYQVT